MMLGLFWLSLPLLTLAHTRWFAETDLPPYVTTEPTGLYVAIWSAITLLVLLVAIYLQRFPNFELGILRPQKAHSFARAASTFTMVVGAYLVIAGTHEYFLTPNLTLEFGIPYWVIIVQIVIGLAMLIGIFARAAALLLGLLWIFTFQYSGFVQGIENIWVLSTAAFIAIMGNDYFSIYSSSTLRKWFSPYKDYGLSLLRLGTGATLMVLGFSEKILAPEFGINFLLQYDWNFMAMLGFNFSDYLFTISAGFVEFMFGLIFVLGLLTRINALVVAIVFTIPMFLLGPIELTGHLPHFAAIILLLLYGMVASSYPFGQSAPPSHKDTFL